jgi:Tyrosine phosphatase family
MARNADINSTSDEGDNVPTAAEANRVPASESRQYAHERGISRHSSTASVAIAGEALTTGGIQGLTDGGSLLLTLPVWYIAQMYLLHCRHSYLLVQDLTSFTVTATSSTSGFAELKLSSVELLPPPNFSLVWRGVYRSSFPKEEHFEHLKSLGLKSIL